MRVYISGPMTGYDDFNYPAFHAAEEVLVSMGYTVENPARNPDPTPATWGNYMRNAIRQLCGCDSILLLPGWSGSRGARTELQIAQILGMGRLHVENVSAGMGEE